MSGFLAEHSKNKSLNDRDTASIDFAGFEWTIEESFWFS